MNTEVQQLNRIWYVVCTQPAAEDRCAAGLHARKFEVYAPSVYRRVPTGRRTADGHKQVREVARPMFPGYIFVRFDPGAEDFAGVRKVPGVREFLKIDARPAVVPPAALEVMVATEAAQFAKYADEVARQERAKQPRHRQPSPFQSGDAVKVIEGPFRDWIAEVERADDLGRVVLLFDLLGRKTRITVDSDALEATA